MNLIEAVRAKNVEGVQTLINQGTDVDAEDDIGSTPLDWAVYGGCEEIVEILLQAGANVNACNNYGHTILQTAIYNEGYSFGIVQKLLEAGANAGDFEYDLEHEHEALGFDPKERPELVELLTKYIKRGVDTLEIDDLKWELEDKTQLRSGMGWDLGYEKVNYFFPIYDSEEYEEIRRDAEQVKNMLKNILSEVERIKHIEADMFKKFEQLQKTKGLKLVKVI